MTKKEAIRKSIKHWKEMIEWVEKRPQESWFEKDCSLCLTIDDCNLCPLNRENICEKSDSLWSKVEQCIITWDAWSKNAKLMLSELKRIYNNLPSGEK